MWEDVRCIILSEYDYKCWLLCRQSKHIILENLKITHKSSVLSDLLQSPWLSSVFFFPSKYTKDYFFPQNFKITDMFF